MSDILYFVILGFIVWFWRDSMRAKEQAVFACNRACKQINAQLLDQTVVLTRLRLCRTNAGTMSLCRIYVFDFTLDGEARREGTITMKGRKILDLVLDIDQPGKLN